MPDSGLHGVPFQKRLQLGEVLPKNGSFSPPSTIASWSFETAFTKTETVFIYEADGTSFLTAHSLVKVTEKHPFPFLVWLPWDMTSGGKRGVGAEGELQLNDKLITTALPSPRLW